MRYRFKGFIFLPITRNLLSKLYIDPYNQLYFEIPLQCKLLGTKYFYFLQKYFLSCSLISICDQLIDVKCNKIKVAKWYNTKNHYNSEAMLEKSICKSKHHTSTKPDGQWIVCFRLLKVGELQIECLHEIRQRRLTLFKSHKHIPLVIAALP